MLWRKKRKESEKPRRGNSKNCQKRYKKREKTVTTTEKLNKIIVGLQKT